MYKKSLITDSMMRDIGQLPHTKLVCKPGVKLSTLVTSIFNELRYCLQSDIVLIHAGTNDINTCTVDELLEMVRLIVRRYRSEYSGHIGFSTIIPRPRDGQSLSNKVKSYNKRLMAWCADNGCVCLRTHSPFLSGGRPRRQLFNNGLLHLRARGPAPSGSYILRNFLSSELSDKTLIPRVKLVEAMLYA